MLECMIAMEERGRVDGPVEGLSMRLGGNVWGPRPLTGPEEEGNIG